MTYPPPAGYPDPNQPQQQGWTPAPATPGQPSEPPADVFGDHQHGGYSPSNDNPSFLPPPEPKKRNGAGVLVGLLVFVVIVAAGVSAYFLGVFDPAVADDDKKTETTADESDDPSTDPSDDPTDDVVFATPTAAVEAYYTAAKAHDPDALIATMCAATYAEYDEQGMTDEQWQQLWDVVDRTEYEITSEAIADDGATATVTVDQVTDGITKTVTANLVLEEEQWKICGFA